MATVSSVFIQIDNERFELVGEDLKAFNAQLKLDAAEAKVIKDANDAKVAARESALAKLAELGLTAEEIAAL